MRGGAYAQPCPRADRRSRASRIKDKLLGLLWGRGVYRTDFRCAPLTRVKFIEVDKLRVYCSFSIILRTLMETGAKTLNVCVAAVRRGGVICAAQRSKKVRGPHGGRTGVLPGASTEATEGEVFPLSSPPPFLSFRLSLRNDETRTRSLSLSAPASPAYFFTPGERASPTTPPHPRGGRSS